MRPVLIVTLVMGLAALQAPAGAQSTGSIVGTVTSGLTGEPIAGVVVEVSRTDSGATHLAETDGAGTFRIDGLFPGSFLVFFHDPVDQRYVPQWYPGVSSRAEGTALELAAGAEVRADVALPRMGFIAGRVTRSDTGAPVARYPVEAVGPDHGGAAMTGPDGRYLLKAPPGSYDVRFASDAFNLIEATVVDVVVTQGATTEGVDAALVVGGIVSGRVTDAATGAAVFDVGVELHHPAWPEPRTGIITRNTDGAFRITGLPAGEYLVRFDMGDFRYLPEWWDDAPERAAASPVVVELGAETSGIDAVLQPGGAITGVVGGGPWFVDEAVGCAHVFDPGGRLVREGYVNPDGSYAIAPLAAGTYRVRFLDCFPTGPQLLTGWHGGALSQAAATAVAVGLGEVTSGVDGVLHAFQTFHPGAEVGFVEPGTSRWHLLDGSGEGTTFYYGVGGDVPLLGDWDGDGAATPGMFRPGTGFAYLRNRADTGVADLSFFFGLAGDVPLAGDWDGDGRDSLAIYRPAEAKVYLSNTLTTGPAEIEYFFGVPGDRPFAGDFDGDGDDEVGLYRPSTGFVYVRTSHTTGVADVELFYGVPGDLVVAGDWDGDGRDGVGAYRSGRMLLRNALTTGPADVEFSFITGLVPVTG